MRDFPPNNFIFFSRRQPTVNREKEEKRFRWGEFNFLLKNQFRSNAKIKNFDMKFPRKYFNNCRRLVSDSFYDLLLTVLPLSGNRNRLTIAQRVSRPQKHDHDSIVHAKEVDVKLKHWLTEIKSNEEKIFSVISWWLIFISVQISFLYL